MLMKTSAQLQAAAAATSFKNNTNACLRFVYKVHKVCGIFLKMINTRFRVDNNPSC